MLGLIGRRPPATRIIGPRVHIRPPMRGDQDAWIEIRRDSRAFLEPWEPTWPTDATSPTGFRRRLRRFTGDWETGHGHAFFVFENAEDRLVGGITLSNVRRGVSQSASVGYWIGKPYARQGYMAEALQLTMDFAFSHLDLHRLEAACLPSNEASRKLLLKAGFRQEGLAREYLCIAGRWQDHVTFGVLRNDPRPSVRVTYEV